MPTTLAWNDRDGTLSIGARHGGFPGMSKVQTFNPVLVDQATGAGIASPKPARAVRYDGRAIRINLEQ